jgi:hypothetical protein
MPAERPPGADAAVASEVVWPALAMTLAVAVVPGVVLEVSIPRAIRLERRVAVVWTVVIKGSVLMEAAGQGCNAIWSVRAAV